MKFDAAFITAIVAALGLAGGWYRSTMQARKEAKKDHSETKHNELDILLEGFAQLARDGNTYRDAAERRLSTTLKNLFDCEATGRQLRAELDTVQSNERKTSIEISELKEKIAILESGDLR